MFSFEETPHVCEECGGSDWVANRFFCNSRKQWHNDDISQWCHDCEREVCIMPKDVGTDMNRQQFFDLLWQAVKNTNVDFYELNEHRADAVEAVEQARGESVYVKFTGIIEKEKK